MKSLQKPLRKSLSEEASSGARLDPAQAEHMMEEREKMLHSLEEAVAPALLEALRAKVAHERALARRLVEDGERKTEAHERSRQVLDPAYFLKKALDLNLL